MSSEIERIESELANLRERLAVLEAADADASSIGQQLRNDWRAASIRADVDGDEAAEAEAAELSQRLINASLADERRKFSITELRSRIASAEAELQRAHAAQPAKFYRREPESQQGFGGLRRALKIPPSPWVPVSEDRVIYELRREFPDAVSGIYRSLKAGAIVPVRQGQWEIRAEVAELVE